MEDKWVEFYKTRVNSTYQNYFEIRYKSYIDFIMSKNPNSIIEMGCGIGSVSKSLLKNNINCSGFDLSNGMVHLANLNVGKRIFYSGNIFNERKDIKTLGVTHGVLEHFSDEQIVQILNVNSNSIHYVPLDKYEKSSFGDERLLSVNHWLNLVDPKEYFLFNNDHDLCFYK